MNNTRIDNVYTVESLAVGYDEQDIVIAFNKHDDGFENAYSIPANKLKDVIMMLFEVGVSYQETTKVDIGFGIEGDE